MEHVREERVANVLRAVWPILYNHWAPEGVWKMRLTRRSRQAPIPVRNTESGGSLLVQVSLRRVHEQTGNGICQFEHLLLQMLAMSKLGHSLHTS